MTPPFSCLGGVAARLSRLLAITLLLSVSTLSGAERATLKLLTIGNSFADNPTEFLPAMAKAGGKELILGRANIGGCPLERHARHLKQAEAGEAEGAAYEATDPKTGKKRKLTLPELLKAQSWEVVTIQQWSQLSFRPETFEPFASELIAAIRKYAPTAEIVVQETWAYRSDHDFFAKGDGFTPVKMYDGICQTYRSFADGKGFRIIPTGDALNLARQTPRWTYVADAKFDLKNPPAGQLPDQRTSLNVGWFWDTKGSRPVFKKDAIHCNTAGKYLGAAVWYETLFNADEVPVAYLPQKLAPEDAADLRVHARAAVQAEHARSAARPTSPAQP